ncbi:FAD binding domain-containing protein [Natrarchaeobius chitinivorans]|uniref:FAD binding domain-containing protein n=1 Tax=Natrarchaeobius chitinivorans TaxID=1679083 RepID=UPI0014056037|nr:xanthine dehydrogenase family protein subunit M [Natrarchaeobius chitinivorans]
MQGLKYANPETVEEACTLLRDHGEDAAILSGGQSLLPMLRQRVGSYDKVIDINGLPDLEYVRETDGEIRIGCLSRHVDVASSSVVEEHCPILADVAAEIGDVQVRNRGTFCGAVAHADPSGDPPVVATLLDATIVARNADEKRTLSGSSFYHGFYETDLSKDELVTEVRFPVLSAGEGAGFEKYEPTEGAYPVATVGAYLSLADDGRIENATLVTGALEAGPTPMDDAAEVLEDREPTDDVLTEAAEQLGEDTMPVDDFEGSAAFKTNISKKLAKDALQTALDRAENER